MKALRTCFLFIAILALISLSSQNFAQVEQKIGSGAIDWERSVIRATGIGTPPPNAVNAAQKRAMTIRAAQADCYRNLLEITQGVRVSSTTTVKDMLTQSDIIRTEINGTLQAGAQIVDTKYLSDGSVEVTMEWSMYGPRGLSTVVYKQDKSQFGTRPPAQPTTTAPSADQKRIQAEMEAARKAKEEAARRQKELEEKARAEAEAKRQAELKAKQLQDEIARKAREETERKAREEEARKAREAELKRLEAEKARKEQERLDAEKRQREAEEAAQKAQAADERKKAEEAARKAAEETARKEAERKAAEDAALKAAQEQARKKAEEDAARKAAEAERIRKEQELKQLEADRLKAEEARRKAEEEAVRKAKEAEERRIAEENAQKQLQQSSSYDANVGDVSAFTGVIIDSSSVSAKPAMSPKVLILPPPPPEKEVYSMAEANYEVALNVGLVGYARTIDSAKKRPRIGNNPLIIKAVGVKSGKPSDIQISYNDGMKLMKLNEQNKVLEKCQVVMVLGSGQAFLLDVINLAMLQP